MEFRYDFSVIVPIYNVEEYLDECIRSVLEQDIGFQEHIQLILINDGSTDGSEAICLNYQKQYPDNIIYRKQENAGVSAARNLGLSLAQGKYLNFLDGDDRWTPGAFARALRFLEEHRREVDIVSCMLCPFGASEEAHPLSFKFLEEEPDRIVDLMRESKSIQLHGSSSFFRAEAIGDLRFEEGLRYGEDALFLNTLLMEKRCYGLMGSVAYDYRSRFDGSSALQGQLSVRSWYLETPTRFLEALAQQSIQRFGHVLAYIQQIIVYDIGYRVTHEPTEALTQEETEQYISTLRNILQNYVSDLSLFKSPVHRTLERKLLLLRLKYGDLTPYLSINNYVLYFNNITLISLSGNPNLFQITSMRISKNKLLIDGVLRKCVYDLLGKPFRLFFRVPGQPTAEGELTSIPSKVYNTIWGPTERFLSVQAKISLHKAKTTVIKAKIQFQDIYENRLNISYGQFAPLTTSLRSSFCIMRGYLLRPEQSLLTVTPLRGRRATLERLSAERTLEREIASLGRKDLVRLRRQALLLRMKLKLQGKKLWLVSDRPDVAGDNGEALFKYLCKQGPKDVIPCFIIDENSPDFQRMQQYGKVIPIQSRQNLLYSLAADKFISSNGNHRTVVPFVEDRCFVADLLKRNYVFLQHGIIKDDLSRWLNKINKDFLLFITSTRSEWESIVHGDYGYPPEAIALTGLARYDTLMEQAKLTPTQKQILVLPTWRKAYESLPIADPEEAAHSADTSAYRLGFKETEFYQFYNGLINHPRLLQAMQEYGYTGLLALHPMINSQWRDFVPNDIFQIQQGYLSYSKAFAQSAVLVTDFSSIFFDFSYLRKPLVYSQFDEEAFFASHTYDKGYFSYEKDGFGPVCRDLESTVDALIDIMKRGGKMAPEYLLRVNQCFAYDDANNCKRTVEAILNAK